MQWKKLNDTPVTHAVILSSGDEAVEQLTRFVREHGIEAGSLAAIGAFKSAVVGYFDWQTKDYRRIPVSEQVEVLSLIGDVAVSEGKPTLHMHVVLGKSDGSTAGGHLLEAQVRPTLEVIVTEPPAYLRKRKDPESGLALIDLENGDAPG
jgi:predicted DNA-binding protein with PD1-like motif